MVLCYILGIIGNFKGVVYYYCGVYLNVIGNIMVWGMGYNLIYLWILLVFTHWEWRCLHAKSRTTNERRTSERKRPKEVVGNQNGKSAFCDSVKMLIFGLV